MGPGLELRWITREPELTADRIARRLLGSATGPTLAFEGLTLPLVRDAEARAEGRLALVPATAGPAGSDRRPRSGVALRIAALGWATVDTDRTVREFAAALDLRGVGEPAPPDPMLGAAVRVLADPRLPGGRVALLEPSTEGRLAATLARDGEGPCALYLLPPDGLAAWLGRARAGGVAMSRPEDGPFGPGVLVLGGPVAGPHLVVVDRASGVAGLSSGR